MERELPMFKRGDLVTGIDRGYERSIYKYVETTADVGTSVYEIYSYNGRTKAQMVSEMQRDPETTMVAIRDALTCIRYDNEFRLATDIEIKLSSNPLARVARDRLLTLLIDLGIERSYGEYEDER